MLLESQYQRNLIRKLRAAYPGAVILKNDSSYIQGIPDWLILDGPNWAAIEVKRSIEARVRPNQLYYIQKMNNMSYASLIYPENELEVLDEIQRALQPNR